VGSANNIKAILILNIDVYFRSLSFYFKLRLYLTAVRGNQSSINRNCSKWMYINCE